MTVKLCAYKVAFLMGVAFTVTGCASPPVHLAPDTGTYYEATKQNQTLNPDAGRNLQPVTALNGDAAMLAYQRAVTRAPEEKSGGAQSMIISTGPTTNK